MKESSDFVNYLQYMEDIRKMVRETLEGIIQEKKRYVAEIDLYIWANDDEDARMQAQNIAKEIDAKYDNRASVKSLGHQPSGSLDYSQINSK